MKPEKRAAFEAALDALCREHGVQLYAEGGNGPVQVCDVDRADAPPCTGTEHYGGCVCGVMCGGLEWT